MAFLKQKYQIKNQLSQACFELKLVLKLRVILFETLVPLSFAILIQ
ncbi:hypothetical protein PAAG_11447 [Paracoccidioides lutzii Pb01]|uniref:Uncharacterized protein n=1 Tax=Paracoccidioides lutzii (strain ATCC MYA-826 / Pb01) TaxID=502779 RepID=A0A0A2VLK6_PARBA|nr:hypothetical protein PAAG_11447 [Paracoccidioides lutzii Pb01]KGQ01729.1 hypothetical protein PAAG_11447 [Paracoccidioides lutzii Pb01]